MALAIAFNPCTICDKKEMCSMCELDMRRKGKVETAQSDKDNNVPSKWISVNDRLPDKHDRYLCNVKAFSFPDLRYYAILKYDDGGFIEGKIYTDDVTHWMPLPEPPKGE